MILVFACWLAYTAAYIGRLNYSASLVEITASLSVTKAAAGTVSAGFFLAYGIGQLANGLLSRFYNEKWVIFGALVSSALLNLAMPLMPGIAAMGAIWLANGLVQSFLWCVLVRLLARCLPDGRLPGAILTMSTTVAAGTFMAYGLAALCARFFSWRLTFWAAAGVMLAAAPVWLWCLTRVEKEGGRRKPAERPAAKEGKFAAKAGRGRLHVKILWPLSIFCLVGLANGFIKDGIITWTPSLLSDRFQLSPSFSIALTLLIPLLSVLGAYAAKWLARRMEGLGLMTRHMAVNGVLYGLTALLLGTMFLSFARLGMAPHMALLVLCACMMAAVNNVLTGMVPLSFRAYADSGLLAGVVNTFCYGGSMASAYALGRLADARGFAAFFLCLAGAALSAALVSLFGAGAFKKFSPKA